MDIQTALSGNQALIFLMIFFLAIAGAVYSELIEAARRRKYLEGYAWLAVAGWLVIILGGLAFISPGAAGLALIAFAAAGLPCAMGEIWRYWRRREKEQYQFRMEVKTASGWAMAKEIRKAENARSTETLAK